MPLVANPAKLHIIEHGHLERSSQGWRALCAPQVRGEVRSCGILMDALSEYRAALLARFADQVGSLKDMLRGLAMTDIHRPAQAGEWSPHQVLAHLLDVERRVNLPRLQRILDQDCPPLEPFDQLAWMAEHYHPQEKMETLLLEFARARAECLALLEALPAQAWNREGCHPELGSHTLQWWLERAVAHTAGHIRQMAQAALQESPG
jgi:hypothetical protein